MNLNKRSLVEIISVLVLTGGLVLVAYQINQATSIASAEITNESTSRWRAVDGTRQGELFAAVLAKSYEDPAALTVAEMIELEAYYMGVVDQMSSAYTMSTTGYRAGSIEAYFSQGALTYFGNPFAKAWWKQYRQVMLSPNPEFVAMFDAAIEAVSETKNLDQYLEIREQLNARRNQQK